MHWKGYEDVTWEPLENLLNDVPDMVEDFTLDIFGIQSSDINTCVWKGEKYFVFPEEKNRGDSRISTSPPP